MNYQQNSNKYAIIVGVMLVLAAIYAVKLFSLGENLYVIQGFLNMLSSPSD